MSRFSDIVMFVFVAVLCATATFAQEEYEDDELAVLKYHWNEVNFTWRTQEEYQAWAAVNGSHFCMPAGIKISHSQQMFVSFPRWNPHVPATLTRVVKDAEGNAVFEPYPSWEMNKEGNVAALQSVLGFEIDAEDRIWILDQGRVSGQQALPGSVKLVVWDIRSNKLVFSYEFPESVAPLNTSFLNDLVLDVRRQKVYITDSGLPLDASIDNTTYGALIVYDIANKSSWRVLELEESTIADQSLWIVINGQHVNPTSPMRTGADGIALTADGSKLYFLPLTSHALYSLPVDLLADPETPEETLRKAVVRITSDRGSASDGLACDNNNTLFLSALEKNGILRLQMEGNVPKFIELASNSSSMRWPDTLGFDHNGNIVYLTNSLYKFVAGTIDWDDEYNFCIWSYKTGTGSYLDTKNASSSESSKRSSASSVSSVSSRRSSASESSKKSSSVHPHSSSHHSSESSSQPKKSNVLLIALLVVGGIILFVVIVIIIVCVVNGRCCKSSKSYGRMDGYGY